MNKETKLKSIIKEIVKEEIDSKKKLNEDIFKNKIRVFDNGIYNNKIDVFVICNSKERVEDDVVATGDKILYIEFNGESPKINETTDIKGINKMSEIKYFRNNEMNFEKGLNDKQKKTLQNLIKKYIVMK